MKEQNLRLLVEILWVSFLAISSIIFFITEEYIVSLLLMFLTGFCLRGIGGLE